MSNLMYHNGKYNYYTCSNKILKCNIADINKAEKLCDFKPKYNFERGMSEFTAWVKSQDNEKKIGEQEDLFEYSINEMKGTGMFIQAKE